MVWGVVYYIPRGASRMHRRGCHLNPALPNEAGTIINSFLHGEFPFFNGGTPQLCFIDFDCVAVNSDKFSQFHVSGRTEISAKQL